MGSFCTYLKIVQRKKTTPKLPTPSERKKNPRNVKSQQKHPLKKIIIILSQSMNEYDTYI